MWNLIAESATETGAQIVQQSSNYILWQTGAIGGGFLIMIILVVWLIRGQTNQFKAVNDQQRADYQAEEAERRAEQKARDERITNAFSEKDEEIKRLNKEFAELAVEAAKVQTGTQAEIKAFANTAKDMVAKMQEVLDSLAKVMATVQQQQGADSHGPTSDAGTNVEEGTESGDSNSGG